LRTGSQSIQGVVDAATCLEEELSTALKGVQSYKKTLEKMKTA
jgi:hypothetical protein